MRENEKLLKAFTRGLLSLGLLILLFVYLVIYLFGYLADCNYFIITKFNVFFQINITSPIVGFMC